MGKKYTIKSNNNKQWKKITKLEKRIKKKYE